jgi:hypothetical protein
MGVVTVMGSRCRSACAELECVHDQFTLVLQAIGRAEECLAAPESTEATSTHLSRHLLEASVAFQCAAACLSRLSAATPA